MRRVIIGVVAAIGFLALAGVDLLPPEGFAESLTCNQCSMGLIGICLKPSTIDCTTNTSLCYTGKATFPSITGFLGFNTQGCLESYQCGVTINSTILGASYVISQTCCNTNKCNPIQISGAPYLQMSLPVALGSTLMTLVWSGFIC